MIETSTEIGELAKALSLAQSEIMAASKDGINPFFKGPDKPKGSSYATLASVWEACRVPLTKNGLSVSQLPVNSNGNVGVVTTLLHSSGQWMRSALLVQPEKNTPQAIGSAITYVRRYALAAVAGVAPEDDDGNEASGHGKGPAGGAQRADKVKATPTALMANASQIQQIHIAKEKIGGWTGKADHPGHPYKLALSAYKNAKGEKCESSKDLTFEQASNLIKRMQGMIDRQAETAKAMEASTPIAGAMNGEREPGSDDGEPSNDNGEPADPGQIEDLRAAAKTRWGTKVKDLAPQWLAKEFGVDTVTALSKVEASRALQILLSGDTL